jgi:hypothetical protein
MNQGDTQSNNQLQNAQIINPMDNTAPAFHTHNGSDSWALELQYFAKLNMGEQAYFIREIDNGNSSTAATIDWTTGNKQKITTTGNCTLTFKNPSGACNLILKVVHTTNATAYTYTYPSTVKWTGGTKPATTNTSGAIDVIAFYFDGTNYYGAGSLNFS